MPSIFCWDAEAGDVGDVTCEVVVVSTPELWAVIWRKISVKYECFSVQPHGQLEFKCVRQFFSG